MAARKRGCSGRRKGSVTSPPAPPFYVLADMCSECRPKMGAVVEWIERLLAIVEKVAGVSPPSPPASPTLRLVKAAAAVAARAPSAATTSRAGIGGSDGPTR